MTWKTRSSLYLLACLISVWANGADFHVSPLGTPQGNGTPEFPIDLATALSGLVGGPGDTFWLHGGTYRGQFSSALSGRPEDRITVRQFPGERATIDGSIVQSRGGFVTYWGFELTSTYPVHASNQGDSAPVDLPTIIGMNLRAPGLRLINLIIHDHTSNGIGLWSESPDSEVYGCLLYHNGWDGTDRGHAHGIYSQNRTGKKRLAENISFQNYSDGIQIYGTDAAFLNNFELDGNVLFNNGIISRWRGGSNLQLGGGVGANGIVVRNNYTYTTLSLAAAVNIGSSANNADLLFENNLIQGSLRIMNWSRSTVMSNLVFAGNSLLELQQFLPSVRSWNWNEYHSDELDFDPFSLVTQTGSFALTFPLWQMLTDGDSHSTYQRGAPAGVRVVVRPNAYEEGRGHVVVYNWERRNEVEADLSKVLFHGSRFEARHAQNFFGPPVVSGVYTGQLIGLPMYSPVPVAAPVGGTPPPPTGPDFNVFVFLSLLPESDYLSRAEDQTGNWPWAQLLRNDTALGPISNLIMQPFCGISEQGGTYCLTNGWLNYQPATNFFGLDFIEYRVLDPSGIVSTGFVYLSILPTPDPPVAQADQVRTGEDLPASWPLSVFLENDTDPDGDEIDLAGVDNVSAQGGMILLHEGMVRYFPPTNYFGTDQFSYRLADATGLSTTGQVSVLVTPINDPPQALPQQLGTRVNTDLDITLQGEDIEQSPLSYEIVTPPQHGVLQGGEAQWRYLPFTSYSGEDRFSFRANDGMLNSDPAWVTLNILPGGHPPVAQPDQVRTAEDQPAAWPASVFLENDSDPDGDVITLASVDPLSAQGGTVLLQEGLVRYSPPTNYFGIDQFNYRLTDATLLSATGQVGILILPINDRPRALAQPLTTREDTGLDIILKGEDVEGSSLSYEIVIPPQHGVLQGGGAHWRYLPFSQYSGEDQFSFRVSDGILLSDPAWITLAIQPVNDAPTARNANYKAVAGAPHDIILEASDPEGDTLTYQITLSPTPGRIEGKPPRLRYTSPPLFTGEVELRFRVSDGELVSDEATIQIQVGSTNTPPVAISKSLSTLEDTPLEIRLEGTDPQGLPLSFSVNTLTQNGNLNGALPNLVYTPNPNFYGEDSLAFTVNNQDKTSEEAVISIRVLSVNDPPIAYVANYITTQNKAVSLTLRGFDPEGDPLGYEIVKPPAFGRLAGTPPAITYWPNPGYVGGDTFVFQTTDGQTNSENASLSIYVAPPSSPPVPPQITATSLQQGLLRLQLTGESERIYIIESSKDMDTWRPASTNYSDIEGNFTYESPVSSNLPQQFYRATHSPSAK